MLSEEILKSILKRLDSVIEDQRKLLEEYGKVHHGRLNVEYGYDVPIPAEETKVYTRLQAAIMDLAPKGSAYWEKYEAVQNRKGDDDILLMEDYTGIAMALREDYSNGYLSSLKSLIRADLFSDYLDMAEYLLKDGYKDPAAVIIGSSLETHLRKLCEKVSVDTTSPKSRFKKADLINADLVKAGAYGKSEQKSVTAWLSLRNDAAHGHYDEYDKTKVELVLMAVRDFINRYPA